MMINRKWVFVVGMMMGLAVGWPAQAAFSDTVFFKDGRELEARILNETEEYIEVTVQGSSMFYMKDEIYSIRRADAAVPVSSKAVKAKALPSN